MFILIFGNFMVYWQISENLNPWSLLYFPICENKSIQYTLVIQRVFNFRREKFCCLFVSVNWGPNWLIDFSVGNIVENISISTTSTADVRNTYIYSNYKDEVHTKLLRYYNLGKLNNAKYANICIHENKSTRKLIW